MNFSVKHFHIYYLLVSEVMACTTGAFIGNFMYKGQQNEPEITSHKILRAIFIGYLFGINSDGKTERSCTVDWKPCSERGFHHTHFVNNSMT